MFLVLRGGDVRWSCGLSYWPAIFWPLALIFAVAGGQSLLEGIPLL